MWGSFVIACLIGLTIIIVPGMLVLRSLRFAWTSSIACAAPLSATVIALAGVLCHALGFDSTAGLIIVSALIVAILCACCYAVPLLRRRSIRNRSKNDDAGANNPSWSSIILYATVNVILMTYLFLRCLDSPESIIPIGDGNFHINVVKSMMDSGNYSTLAVSPYPDTLPSEEVPFASMGYYPAAWHAITALIAILAGTSAMIAENASNFLFASIVFPLGALALIRQAFPEHKRFVLWGAFTICASVAFPLRPLLVHQIYPNIAGFACIPISIALFLVIVRPTEPRSRRIRYAAAFLMSMIGTALLHPGAFLACCVFLFAVVLCTAIPRAATILANRTPSHSSRLSRRTWFTLLAIGWVVLAIIVWLVLLDSSFLQNVTNFLWTWTISIPQALFMTLTLGLCLGAPQYLLAILMFIGLIFCLRRQEYRWMAGAAILFLIIFVCGAAGTPEIKRLFAGFWYTDPERTSALVAIAIIPLTTAGLDLCYSSLRQVLLRRRRKTKKSSAPTSSKRTITGRMIAFIMLALFVTLNYLSGKIPLPVPGFGSSSGFNITRQALAVESDPTNSWVYTMKEMDFVDEVLETVDQAEGSDDALLINMPHDGSLFSYSLNDANVYYKSYDRGKEESRASEIIRLSLDKIATDSAVQDAVLSTGAEYVLLLERDPKGNYDSNSWCDEEWMGLERITDATPGFEVVLSEGDMRLYRITALD